VTGTLAPSWFDGILARNHQPGRSTRRSRKRTLRK
jgi:hypothetical protein